MTSPLRVLKPTTVTTAMVTASNVPTRVQPSDVAAGAPYVAGATYDEGAQVTFAVGAVVGAYKSLKAANTNNTPNVSSTWWAALDSAPGTYATGTTYALGDKVAYIVGAGPVTLYRSLQAANVGHAPDVSPTWWEVIEVVPAAYVAGTTYPLNAQVSVAGTLGMVSVYKSLQASNTGHTPASSPTWWALVCTAPALYASATSYAVDALAYVVGDAGLLTIYKSLQASNTGHTPASSPTWWVQVCTVYRLHSPVRTYATGDRVQDNATHLIYESAAASNIGNSPPGDVVAQWWTPVGPTNDWAVFDQRNSSQTVLTGGIDLTIAPGEVFNGLAILNVQNVGSVQLTETDPVDGVVYDVLHPMQAPPSEADYYAYFFDPIVLLDSLLVTGLPAYRSASLRVRINASSTAAAAVGVLALGRVRDIGIGVQAGAKVGIQDYSIKKKNDFGDYEIVERAFAKRASFEMWVPSAQVDSVQDYMAGLRATPVVWIGTGKYSSTTVYGFYEDFDLTLAYTDYAVFNLNIEGLT